MIKWIVIFVMDFDSIWYDEEVDLVNENKNEEDNVYYDYDSEETSISFFNDENKEDDEEEEESAIPEKILEYYLSPARGERLKYIRDLSLKNRRQSADYNKRIASNNTRRNKSRTNQCTPKRRRVNVRDNKKNHKKTKKVIILNQ